MKNMLILIAIVLLIFIGLFIYGGVIFLNAMKERVEIEQQSLNLQHQQYIATVDFYDFQRELYKEMKDTD